MPRARTHVSLLEESANMQVKAGRHAARAYISPQIHRIRQIRRSARRNMLPPADRRKFKRLLTSGAAAGYAGHFFDGRDETAREACCASCSARACAAMIFPARIFFDIEIPVATQMIDSQPPLHTSSWRHHAAYRAVVRRRRAAYGAAATQSASSLKSAQQIRRASPPPLNILR